MLNPRIALATLALALVGGGVTAYGIATMPQPAPVAAPVAVTADGAPYCMFDAENLTHATVAGPAGGTITVAGHRVGELSLVDAIDTDVAVDAGPYDGIQYNIPGPGEIAVDGNVCEIT